MDKKSSLIIQEEIGTQLPGVLDRSDMEPQLHPKEGTLLIFSGIGKEQPWGSSKVTSTVIHADDCITAVHIRFHHRDGMKQFWRFYRRDPNDGWTSLAWNALVSDERLKVLSSYPQTAPAWTTPPGSISGKERREHEVAMNKGPTYLIAIVCEEGLRYQTIWGRPFSLGEVLTQTGTQPVLYQSHEDCEYMLIRYRRRSLFSPSDYRHLLSKTLAVLECEVDGEIVRQAGFIKSSSLHPREQICLLCQ